MEATLKALADLLVEAVPTIVFFLFLTWYLKRVYFKPLGAVLEQRRKATEGVRDLAQRAFEAADKKTSEWQRALELAREEIARDNEKIRQQWIAEQNEAIAKTRGEVEAQIAAAKRDIAAEAERAQNQLDTEVEALSSRIVDSVTGRRAA